MEQLDLDALLARSYEICEALTKANVGDVCSEGRSLRNLLRNDLVTFGGYLVEGDGVIAPDEVQFVASTLGLAQDAPIIEQLKRRTLDTSTAKKAPFSLKYAVLADAGRKLSPDPFKGQCAAIFYDTFRVFGKSIMALRKADISSKALHRLHGAHGGHAQGIRRVAVAIAEELPDRRARGRGLCRGKRP